MEIIARIDQQLLYDKKWQRFLRKTRLFRYIPFVEIVFGSGSMAVGNVDEESDFDVLIGAREGRIFSARFFCAIVFGILGWRRSKVDHSEAASDKICLNHFMTPATYQLSLTKNEYWKRMYQGLAPVYGSDEKIQQFFSANEWAAPFTWAGDLRHRHFAPAGIKKFKESLLGGGIGDFLENLLKSYQIKRIESGLPRKEAKPARVIEIHGDSPASFTLPPLIVYTDKELEFHPDPVRIEIVK